MRDVEGCWKNEQQVSMWCARWLARGCAVAHGGEMRGHGMGAGQRLPSLAVPGAHGACHGLGSLIRGYGREPQSDCDGAPHGHGEGARWRAQQPRPGHVLCCRRDEKHLAMACLGARAAARGARPGGHSLRRQPASHAAGAYGPAEAGWERWCPHQGCPSGRTQPPAAWAAAQPAPGQARQGVACSRAAAASPPRAAGGEGGGGQG